MQYLTLDESSIGIVEREVGGEQQGRAEIRKRLNPSMLGFDP